MGAPEGNQFWKARAKNGRDKIFSGEKMLWEAACEYFEWVEDNPLKEAKLFKIKGDDGSDEITQEECSKMRAMTIDGLCLFLGIGLSTWSDYKHREGYEEFSAVIERIESVVTSQKFAGAAADLLNANIIARDLGLKDLSKSEHSGPDGGPIKTQATVIAAEMDPTVASEIYKDLMQ